MSIRKASITFGVPKTTLIDKLKGRVPIERNIGAPSVLTKIEEGHLVNWIISSAKAGFPITRTLLTDSVQLLLKELKRENPFPKNRPQRHWHEGFLKRHPEIAHRVPQNLCGRRAIVTEEKIRNWFQEVSDYLKEYDQTIFNDRRRVFNCDETAMFLCPKGEKVFTEKGQKTVYSLTNNDEKECLTTLVMCNADGELAPPMIMYSYKRIPKIIIDKVPKNWAIGKSDNGWMTGESFFEYIANVFFPWLKENNVDFPVLLFVDGHTSHLTMQLSDFCLKNKIILVSLFPNSTHILQPLDVAVFHPLKIEWRRSIVQWRLESGGGKLTKEYFAPLLNKVFENMKDRLPLIIQNGFRTCGLYPFCPDSIKFDKYFKSKENLSETNKNIDEVEVSTCSTESDFLIFFEIHHKDKIDSFRNSGNTWQGEVEDTNLFYFWQFLKGKAQRNKTLSTNKSGNKNDYVQKSSVIVLENIQIVPPDTTLLPDSNFSSSFCSLVENYEYDNDEIQNAGDLLDSFVFGEINDINNKFQDDDILNMEFITDNSVLIQENHISDEILQNNSISTQANNILTEIENHIPDETQQNNSISTQANNIPTEIENIPDDTQQNNSISTHAKNIITEIEDELDLKTPEKNQNNQEVTPDIKQKYNLIESTIDSNKENTNIPTPFKNALFWNFDGVEDKTSKRKPIEKVPAVASSEQWQQYHKRKQEKKDLEIKEKESRKTERLEKQEAKEKQQKKKKSAIFKINEEVETSECEEDEIVSNFNTSHVEIGDYVIIKYDESFFPGLVTGFSEKKTEKEFIVKAMTKSGRNWKWPKTEDILNYTKHDVISKISKPKLCNKRGLYEVPEISKI